jgi:hypothetical protein
MLLADLLLPLQIFCQPINERGQRRSQGIVRRHHEKSQPNVHGERWLKRRIRLTLASRQSGADENGADLF